MGYYTKVEALAAANIAVLKHPGKRASQILNESRITASANDQFDIFLSHSFDDANLILGVKNIMENRGLKVYVDWIDDAHMSRQNVNRDTAETIRTRMRQSKSLIFVATQNSSDSKWMPWELGYFDGLKEGRVGILPLLDNSSSKFDGQEYLSLYPIVEKGKYVSGAEEVFVYDKKNRWNTLDKFAKGDTSWKNF